MANGVDWSAYTICHILWHLISLHHLPHPVASDQPKPFATSCGIWSAYTICHILWHLISLHHLPHPVASDQPIPFATSCGIWSAYTICHILWHLISLHHLPHPVASDQPIPYSTFCGIWSAYTICHILWHLISLHHLPHPVASDQPIPYSTFCGIGSAYTICHILWHLISLHHIPHPVASELGLHCFLSPVCSILVVNMVFSQNFFRNSKANQCFFYKIFYLHFLCSTWVKCIYMHTLSYLIQSKNLKTHKNEVWVAQTWASQEISLLPWQAILS